jgi:hypothetical protein
MAEKHDRLLAKYRTKLVRKGYTIENRSPFVDYRPDIYGSKNGEKRFVEVETESTLHSEHTLGQLEKMYIYLEKNKKYNGVLVVPKSKEKEAVFLIKSVFGNKKIIVFAMEA